MKGHSQNKKAATAVLVCVNTFKVRHIGRCHLIITLKIKHIEQRRDIYTTGTKRGSRVGKFMAYDNAQASIEAVVSWVLTLSRWRGFNNASPG